MARNHTNVVLEADVGSAGGELDYSSTEVSQAIEDVRAPGSSTRWVVLGYEGNTGRLKVVETGDGDLEELVEELNPGKVLYAYWRAVDTSAPKFLYISWVGEGAPATIKAKANSHSPTIARQVVKHVHVTINARNADDLEEEAVMKKIQLASGANYDAGSVRG